MNSTQNRVIVILVDGMRPDGLTQCGNPFVQTMLEKWAHSLSARTVMPSVTLPCHMSLFHSVDPDRHGILTNTYVPQVRPVKGLVDALDEQDRSCAFYITWEELRDLCRPDHLRSLHMLNLHKNADTDRRITAAAIEELRNDPTDFAFLYLGETDEVGHGFGWMGEQYEACISKAVDCIRQVYEALSDSFSIIVLADHGGHARGHGSEQPEDMTIPVFACGPAFTPGTELENVSIKDIAPTVARLLGVEKTPPEWEGRSLV